VLRSKLTDAIREIQDMSGDSLPDDFGDEDANNHLGEISNFDSMRGAEVSSRLSRKVGCDIEDLVPLFDPQSYDGVEHFDEIEVSQVVNHLDEIVSNKQ